MSFGNSFDFDFNTAESRSGFGELIPENTVALVVATIRRGKVGADGWLTLNKDRNAMFLDMEFQIEDGPFRGRKFWERMTVELDTSASEGQRTAQEISRSNLRGMVESARGIKPGDDSPEAMQRRKLSSWGDINGLRFCAKVGIEKAKPGSGYDDKNKLKAAVGPDSRDYIAPGDVPQQPQQQGFGGSMGGGQAQGGGSFGRPGWAA
jgi:hypothetical protein